ncbi:MAG: hypothetical protein GTN67_08280 [Hydrotalea flava]|uniref:hypothetical protein n=1 Tax=Hydrotalea TaxID=1004300 RepID=UPI001024E306|nr:MULTISPECIES: hypothetical protein [Hydrotalea]NIM35369.1 hypothetical protein [Hydrotalea flava]NIM38228.1 hypothetical protein [Hydrotalea flava]NIN03392.1 hypothetical protein [Hydrotalea flava]NIN15086.1 hypothetical protein [Hydrotalea flava]NIO94154.1 hypothetical protein [Hydrotalea flava]
MRWLIIPLITIFHSGVFAQCKTFMISDRGDTLNCIDMNNKKQGKWLIHLDELRGEPGYEEEGEYKDNLKEGRWRRYSLMGDLIAVENYRWGNKDGQQEYFYNGSLEHVESWKAIDPQKKYDTIYVPDLYDEYKVDKKIIKINAYAVKDGVWKYYLPGSSSLIRTETYSYDAIVKPKPVGVHQKDTSANTINKNTLLQDSLPKEKVNTGNKPKEILQFEKKNQHRKKVKVRDGTTGN